MGEPVRSIVLCNNHCPPCIAAKSPLCAPRLRATVRFLHRSDMPQNNRCEGHNARGEFQRNYGELARALCVCTL